jgi:hypothetical protein
VIALSDGQLAMLMDAARPLPVEKREVFLSRVAGYLDLLHGIRVVGDHALQTAIRASMVGLVVQAPAPAALIHFSAIRP